MQVRGGGEEAAERLASLCRTSPALLHKCAIDFARDYRRVLTRRQCHEENWPQIQLQEGGTLAWDCADAGASVDAGLLRETFRDEVGAALGRLTPLQYAVFCQHYVEERPLTAIADDMGRTPCAIGQTLYAIGQTLYRARLQLRTALKDRL